jgi:hypothetical protein
MAVPARLELATFGLGNRCSIRLSYGTNKDKANLYHAGDRRAGRLAAGRAVRGGRDLKQTQPCAI